MVMKHHFGPESMRRFLRFEFDQYLRGRAQERNEENPLYKVDPNQGYIHYNKGAMVMYALQDYIGEDKVNEAIREFLKTYAFKGPPYPTSLDLEGYFRKVTPPEYQYLFDDLFQNITLYDDRALSAEYVQRPDGKYDVHLTLKPRRCTPMDEGRSMQSRCMTGSTLACWTPVGSISTCRGTRSSRRKPTSLSQLTSCRPRRASIQWTS